MRSLGTSRWILVASPQVASRLGGDISAITDVETLDAIDDAGEVEWRFARLDGETRTIRHEPRMTCSDFAVLREAAADGLGVAFLPDHVCTDDIASGRLVHVHRDWRGREGIVHLVFTTRRGLPPAVRALINDLAKEFPTL